MRCNLLAAGLLAIAPWLAPSLALGLTLGLAPSLASAQMLPESFERCRNPDDPKAGIAACTEVLQSQGLLQAERARTFVTLAGYQRQTGQFAAALANLDRAAEIAPNAPGIPLERAITLHMSGDLSGAMRAHARAFALGPGSPAMFNNRGVTELALGQSDAAIADFDAALALMANNATTLGNRATAKCRAGDVDGAVADNLAALEIGDAGAAALEAAVAAAGFPVGSAAGAAEKAEALEGWARAGCPGAPEPRFL